MCPTAQVPLFTPGWNSCEIEPAYTYTSFVPTSIANVDKYKYVEAIYIYMYMNVKCKYSMSQNHPGVGIPADLI